MNTVGLTTSIDREFPSTGPSQVVAISGHGPQTNPNRFNAIRAALCEVGRLDLAANITGATFAPNTLPQLRHQQLVQGHDMHLVAKAITITEHVPTP